MNIGLAFWIIMLVWLLLWGGTFFVSDPRLVHGGTFVLWVLLALLGWHAFGPMLKG
jgi:hypothetical protein